MILQEKNTEKKSTKGLEGLEASVIESIQNRKGSRITELDLSKLEYAPAMKFIICEGKSTSQVAAIADNIREDLQKEFSIKPYNYDGYRNAQWIVIDYGDLMVHVFQHETRDFYNLEELWSDAEVTVIPDLD